jgi:outer membrane immunogenic protein
MNSKILLAVASSLMISGSAVAADMPVKARIVAPVATWTGCYIGVNGGWARSESHVTWAANPVGFPISGPFIAALSTNTLSDDGIVAGVQYGCNWQGGSWVAGLESDFDWTDLNARRRVAFDNGVIAFTEFQDYKVTWLSTSRVRLGYLVTENVLFYGTVGVATGHVRTHDLAVFPTSANEVFRNANKFGGTIGAGVEFNAMANWTVKAEYLYSYLGNVTSRSFNPVFANADIYNFHKNINVQTVRLGLNYRLNWGGPVVANY